MTIDDVVWRPGSSLTVLGGSSPFTVVLADELSAANLPPGGVTLCGRDEHALSAVSTYMAAALEPLGWMVRTTTDPTEALQGSRVVLHQIRYGGLDGRAIAEEVAVRAGLPADETLGPAGTFNAVTVAPEITAMARRINQMAPGAVVLNITNPLSVSTAILLDAGCGRVLGLCELPQVTFDQACASLAVETANVTWSYAGLNHRGFLYELRDSERDLIDALAGREDISVGGVTAATVARLHALPSKYHALVEPGGHDGFHGVGRAKQLVELRADVLRDLGCHATRRPPSLDRRPCPWYGVSIVPVLRALAGDDPGPQVVNVRTDDRIVREVRASIGSDGGVDRAQDEAPPSAVAKWIDVFEAHESQMLQMVASPSGASIRSVLQADPAVPADRVEAAAKAVEWGLLAVQPGKSSSK